MPANWAKNATTKVRQSQLFTQPSKKTYLLTFLLEFIDKIATSTPYTLPDTTPIISNAAFQLLAFAMERSGKAKCNATSFGDILSASFLDPLNMTQSKLLDSASEDGVFGGDFKAASIGEPA